jgi:hypothetical protein
MAKAANAPSVKTIVINYLWLGISILPPIKNETEPDIDSNGFSMDS